MSRPKSFAGEGTLVAVWVPRKLKRELRRLSSAEGTSLSEFCRRALELAAKIREDVKHEDH